MRSTMIEVDHSGDESPHEHQGTGRAYGRKSSDSIEDRNKNRPCVYQVAGCTGNYTDVVSASIQSVQRVLLSPKSKRKGPRGGVSDPFPSKLYEMLVGLEVEEGLGHVAAWREHGRCFEIAKPHLFADDVMPR
jgi:hypothetical protein